MTSDRVPVLSSFDGDMPVQMQLRAWTAADMLPDYRYTVQQEVSPAADTLWNEFMAFLDENSEMLQTVTDRDAFKIGFQRCMALTRLFIDSLYVAKDGENSEVH